MQQRISLRKLIRPIRRRRRPRPAVPPTPTTPQQAHPAEQQAEERDYGRLAQEADHLFDTSATWW
jgi:hypothetical protein